MVVTANRLQHSVITREFEQTAYSSQKFSPSTSSSTPTPPPHSFPFSFVGSEKAGGVMMGYQWSDKTWDDQHRHKGLYDTSLNFQKNAQTNSHYPWGDSPSPPTHYFSHVVATYCLEVFFFLFFLFFFFLLFFFFCSFFFLDC